MLDLTPTTNFLSELVIDLRDDQLDEPTPCAGVTVGDLLAHIEASAVAFSDAAAKKRGAGSKGAPPDRSRLSDDWRTRIPERLAALANAWKDEEAWTGMTEAGGLDLPGEVAGAIAIDECVVHGWDLAVATGHEFTCAPSLVTAALRFVEGAVSQNPEGTPGLFEKPLPVDDDAKPITRLISLTGRDPNWSSPSE